MQRDASQKSAFAAVLCCCTADNANPGDQGQHPAFKVELTRSFGDQPELELTTFGSIVRQDPAPGRSVIRLMVQLPHAIDEDLSRRGLSLTRYVVLMRLSEAFHRALRLVTWPRPASIHRAE